MPSMHTRNARPNSFQTTVGVLTLLTLFLVLTSSGCRKGEPTHSEWHDDDSPAVVDPLDDVRSAKKGLRVLFVGNSFTYFHNMPDMVGKMARAANEELPLFAVQETPGGRTLQQHWESGAVVKLIESAKWDWVVLQEQSQLPALAPAVVDNSFDPFVRQFDGKIKMNGARSMLYLTWGYKNGDPGVANDSYTRMQERLNRGYLHCAKSVSAEVAPVGSAWEEALKRDPKIDLWDGDGRHPSQKGSYLAACVFYGMLYGKSPLGNAFTADLAPADAKFLQQVADDVLKRTRKEAMAKQ